MATATTATTASMTASSSSPSPSSSSSTSSTSSSSLRAQKEEQIEHLKVRLRNSQLLYFLSYRRYGKSNMMYVVHERMIRREIARIEEELLNFDDDDDDDDDDDNEAQQQPEEEEESTSSGDGIEEEEEEKEEDDNQEEEERNVGCPSGNIVACTNPESFDNGMESLTWEGDAASLSSLTTAATMFKTARRRNDQDESALIDEELSTAEFLQEGGDVKRRKKS